MVVAAPASPDPPSQDSSRGMEGGQRSKKKGGGISLSSLKSPFKFLGKTYCKGCRKKCSGEVLKVNDFYFHNQCFRCKGCESNLSQGGFFTREKDYYCAGCYQSNFGTKCTVCGKYVEGEVVTALGKTYHQGCFKCGGCSKPFPTGERVTFTGKTCLCQECAVKNEVDAPTGKESSGAPLIANSLEDGSRNGSAFTSNSAQYPKIGTDGSKGDPSSDCAGCGSALKDGQALMALDKHYHVWCFKCKACGSLLHGEYMGKDGQPYCEKDYQSLFGVKCTYCFRFISGKVLQAGDNNHFHPTCARCTKCGEPFGDGEEMFLQGAAIWHPRCGPSPEESGSGIHLVSGGYGGTGAATSPYPPRTAAAGYGTDHDLASNASELPHHGGMSSSYAYGSRASSPGGSLLRRNDHWRSTSQMAGGGTAGVGHFMPSLYSSSSTYSLRRPLEPGDRTGSSSHLVHLHIPPSRRASSSAGDRAGLPPPRCSTRASMDHIPIGGGYRPVSAPPKPGYTQTSVRSATLPTGSVMQSPLGSNSYYDHVLPQVSHYRTEFASDMMRQSNTFTRGYRPPSGRQTPVITEHKIYPLHLVLVSNYKLPPDVDRCNLEKHLSDEDFEMVFRMTRDEFYRLPVWRRNDMKRRVRLF